MGIVPTKIKTQLLRWLARLTRWEGWYAIANYLPYWKEALVSLLNPAWAYVWAEVVGASDVEKMLILLGVAILLTGFWIVWLAFGSTVGRRLIWATGSLATVAFLIFAWRIGTEEWPKLAIVKPPVAPESAYAKPLLTSERPPPPAVAVHQQSSGDNSPNTSTSGDNSPNVGSIAPGAVVSFGQQGGQIAGTIINEGPIERHLTPAQREALNVVAAELPESMATSLTIQAIPNRYAAIYAREIRDVFISHNKTIKFSSIVVDKNPELTGVYVLIRGQEDNNFPLAQKIATALSGSGVNVHFTAAEWLPPQQIQIRVQTLE